MFQSSVRSWFVNEVGIFEFYHTWDSRKSDKGFPDCVAACPEVGRTLYAELKTETGEVSDDQVRWLLALAANPANEVYVWRPSDAQEVTSYIQSCLDEIMAKRRFTRQQSLVVI